MGKGPILIQRVAPFAVTPISGMKTIVSNAIATMGNRIPNFSQIRLGIRNANKPAESPKAMEVSCL